MLGIKTRSGRKLHYLLPCMMGYIAKSTSKPGPVGMSRENEQEKHDQMGAHADVFGLIGKMIF
ncbi:hypothetical protein [Saccharibacter floricola]|uniref:Uncharacterized protein n=1 Tax=Saccharibacter floricola DSM 15669 TaxID=1123227 RepID=A0ABQ0P1D9_9PROT|nr:hypothetical protein [Saccharibacter floricola]GBQ08924.1 hypothetical protein AA15669_1966 [Saccharibacter floricola DSM 15669]